MKVLDPGHYYELATLDRESAEIEVEASCRGLRFVKRVGEKYPGNEAPGYEGTTSQEVLRALIDRTKYVNNQESDYRNLAVLENLREALWFLEHRAAERRGELRAMTVHVMGYVKPGIETLPTCLTCGHIACGKHV